MSDNVTFQSATTATPPTATVIATDHIGARHFQWVKLAYGDDGTAYALGYGTPMPLGTLPGGSIQIVGTSHITGTVSPLPGSVHLASRLPGTVDIGTIAGTVQMAGTFQPLAGSVHLASSLPGTSQVIGTVQPLAGSAHLATSIPGTSHITGTVSFPTGGTMHIGSVQGVAGTIQALGTVSPLPGSVHLASRLPGTVDIGTIAGTVSALGTVQPLAGSVHLANVMSGTTSFVTGGTAHIGSVQRLAGGTIDQVTSGTITAIRTPAGDSIIDEANDAIRVNVVTGSGGGVTHTDDAAFTVGVDDGVPAFGVYQAAPDSVNDGDAGALRMTATRALITTVETPAGDSAMDETNDALRVHVVAGGGTGGTSASDDSPFTPGATAMTPIGAYADDVAPDSVNEGDVGAVRMSVRRELYVQIRDAAGNERGVNVDASGAIAVTFPGTIPVGTIAGTVSMLGTTQPLAGSVHPATSIPGTSHITGTVQPLAGSAHLATNLAGGTVVSVGSAIHDTAADARPHLIGAFGSSGTQAAVNDGDAVRLWADLNGRLHVRGTIDSLPNVTITAGTVSLHTGGTMHIGTLQRVAGGTIDSFGGTIGGGTVSIAGSVWGGTFTLAGTAHIGSIQRIAGTVDIGTIAGAVRVGTVPGGTIIAQPGGFGSYIGTSFTAAVANGTLIAPTSAGTRFRIFDITVSASASGTFRLGEAATAVDGTPMFGPLFFAGSGGWQFNSARGITNRHGDQRGVFCSVSAGTISVTINYTLEGTA